MMYNHKIVWMTRMWKYILCKTFHVNINNLKMIKMHSDSIVQMTRVWRLQHV